MDPTHFDTLTRLFGAATDRTSPAGRFEPTMTRRQGIAAVVAGLAGLLGLTYAGPATAGPGAAAKPCLKNGTRCHRHSGGTGDPCRRCCSGFSKRRNGSKGRRCTCAPQGKRCKHANQCCGALRCAAGRCATPEARCGEGAPCRVFVTSSLHTGALGGLDGADALCQDLADEAGLPGTYRAWLSDSTGSPASHFLQSRGPYVLVDAAATVIAADWADLTDGTLAAPISVTETGASVAAFVWTGTTASGIAAGGGTYCANWTDGSTLGSGALVGLTTQTGSGWTSSGSATGCPFQGRLYCFQQA